MIDAMLRRAGGAVIPNMDWPEWARWLYFWVFLALIAFIFGGAYLLAAIDTVDDLRDRLRKWLGIK